MKLYVLIGVLIVALISCDKGMVTVEIKEQELFANGFEGSVGRPSLNGWKLIRGTDTTFVQDAPPGWKWSIELQESRGPESITRTHPGNGSGIYELRVWMKFVPGTVGQGAPPALTMEVGTSDFKVHLCKRDTAWHEEVLRDTLSIASVEMITLGINGGYSTMPGVNSRALFTDISFVKFDE